jgi:hypothetical protein
MAPEISLERQRPAQFVFSRHVERMLANIQRKNEVPPKPRQPETSAGAQ